MRQSQHTVQGRLPSDGAAAGAGAAPLSSLDTSDINRQGWERRRLACRAGGVHAARSLGIVDSGCFRQRAHECFLRSQSRGTFVWTGEWEEEGTGPLRLNLESYPGKWP